jgi:DNA-binding response OmpR family regulator
MARILVIDDMSGILQTLDVMLKGLGHEPTCAGDSETGLKYARENSYDVIMTDIMMPDKDGVDVIMELRQQDNPPPIIAISGGGTKVSADDALSIARLHADNVIKKPFKRDQLAAIIDETLEAAQSSKA